MSDVSQIDGSAIRLKRESQGWAIADLASRACLSVKQIRQIEEGGMTAFYSDSVKLTAARKVAGLLQMSEIQLFGQQLPVVEHHQDDETLLHNAAHVTSAPLTERFAAAPAANPIMRSEALHVLAQPPEHVEEDVPEAAASEMPEAAAAAQTLAPTTAAANSAAPAQETQPAGNGYLLKIIALFLVALAAAALLRPKVLEEKSEAAAVETPAPTALVPSTGAPATEAAPSASEAVPANNATAVGTAAPSVTPPAAATPASGQ